MESAEDDEELKLFKASATLLSDLEASLPKLLWRPAKSPSPRGRVHSHVKQRDLDHVLKLIEPFQGEPQLLDARLKYLLPPLVEAYLEFLQLGTTRSEKNIDLQEAICTILYTLCKVRGSKVIVGFLSNEPRYFELILLAAEGTVAGDGSLRAAWQVPYSLLLWLSHLLLTPFDLASISDTAILEHELQGMKLPKGLPLLAVRTLRIGLVLLPSSSKAQDAAAAMISRLVTRPDMQQVQLADLVVERSLQTLKTNNITALITVYEYLGPLRLLASLVNTADLGHLFPTIYKVCDQLSSGNDDSALSSNAVAKKMLNKIFRNITIHSLRYASAGTALLEFLETTSVLENVIDHLLGSLGDRDTPVRYGAAKAISLIILEVEPSMGYDIVQAILDTFKEDMPRQSDGRDFRTANALKWHGLTLALGHALFKRTAAPEQLPDIVTALVLALQFEQRTATSSSIGTNVRDAANFGLWSMSRRYTTEELLAVGTSNLQFGLATNASSSVIQAIATQLILSACLDPAGNIRRGSSAALQELIGRHPNQVSEGISLVQTVEYQAVGLRGRAMIDVANYAAAMDPMYHSALVDGLLQWRGLGSPDVPSREAAATSIASLYAAGSEGVLVLDMVLASAQHMLTAESEAWHGVYLTLAYILNEERKQPSSSPPGKVKDIAVLQRLCHLVALMPEVLANLSPRVLRSEVPTACARLITSVCNATSGAIDQEHLPPLEGMDAVTERLLTRREDSILEAIPEMVQGLLDVKRKQGLPLGHISATALSKKVTVDGSKSTLNGAGRAIALGATVDMCGNWLGAEEATNATETLAKLMDATNVDWRIIGLRAIQLPLKRASRLSSCDANIFQSICNMVLRGMRDCTIDERGDIGSLVRLQAISCVASIFELPPIQDVGRSSMLNTLRAEAVRLSLEKLDRVRLQAAQCALGPNKANGDIHAVSTYAYFYDTMQPLQDGAHPELCTAILEGCISCAGVAVEPLLQVSRSALVDILNQLEPEQLHVHLTSFSTMLRTMVQNGSNTLPALELLAFLLDMQTLQSLTKTDFKWRNLLSTVQKSHHKSNDIPKILAAVHVYRGMADVDILRGEVLKKLVGMLKTNPYPTVRLIVAETLWMITGDDSLLVVDWTKGVKVNGAVLEELRARHEVA